MSVIRSPIGSNGLSNSKPKVENIGLIVINSIYKMFYKFQVSAKRALSTSEDREPSDENYSDSEAQLDFDNSKDYNPNEDSDDSNKGKRKKLKREDSTDVDDLLSSDEEEDDDDALTRFYKKRDAQKKKEEERRREKEKKKEQERKSKSFSKTEMRDKLKSPQKERIKEIAKKMKEESKSSSNSSSSLAKIPKLSKSELEKKNSGPSFGDMMGGLDSFKSKPKAAPIKNKNKDLLESLDSGSPLKPKPRSDSKSDKHRSEREKEKSRDKDRERDRDKDRHKSREKERSKEGRDKDHRRERRDSLSKSSDGSKHSKGDREKKSDTSERPKPKLNIPEKRSHKDASLQSPKEEKRSPKVIKESNFLGDILGDIMKEPPRKKKRRPSDVKVSESSLKELAEKVKADTEKDSTPESEKENTPESGSGDGTELDFSEPTSDLPREVRGILVYVKGRKAKRKIQWRPEDKLVDVRYIEIEEDERVNVFKVKSFEEMKKKEAMMEKTKGFNGFDMTSEEQEDSKPWRLIPLRFEGEQKEITDKLLEIAGQDSVERKVQSVREASVLKFLQFNNVPKDPSEPDPGSNERREGQEMKEIPLEDLSENRDESAYSYSGLAWPLPAGVPPTIPTNLNALLSNINPSLISSLPNVSLPPPPDLSKPPPSAGLPGMSPDEQELLAAQKAAAAAFGFQPAQGVNNHGAFNNGFNGHRGGQRGHHYQDRGFKGGFGHNNRERFREGGRKEYSRPYKFFPHPSR